MPFITIHVITEGNKVPSIINTDHVVSLTEATGNGFSFLALTNQDETVRISESHAAFLKKVNDAEANLAIYRQAR